MAVLSLYFDFPTYPPLLVLFDLIVPSPLNEICPPLLALPEISLFTVNLATAPLLVSASHEFTTRSYPFKTAPLLPSVIILSAEPDRFITPPLLWSAFNEV